MGDGYDTAQICLNGHVVSSMAASCPQFQQTRCDKCGEETIMACAECSAPIRGFYHVSGVFGGYSYDAPNFCHNCGEPFPWTGRALAAAAEFAREELSDGESASFEKHLSEIIGQSGTHIYGRIQHGQALDKCL